MSSVIKRGARLEVTTHPGAADDSCQTFKNQRRAAEHTKAGAGFSLRAITKTQSTSSNSLTIRERAGILNLPFPPALSPEERENIRPSWVRPDCPTMGNGCYDFWWGVGVSTIGPGRWSTSTLPTRI